MQKAIASMAVVVALSVVLGRAGEAMNGAGSRANAEWQMLTEQQRFLECLAEVYDPGMWIGYGNRLYFMPRSDAQFERLQAIKAERGRFVAFTNREAQHQLAAKVLAQSGLSAEWQSKLLVPYAPTNRYLTPVLDRPVQILVRYAVLKDLPMGDALIQAGESTCRVMGFGRGAGDAYRTNALLVKEGWTTYRTESNEVKRVNAFTDVALTAAETAALEEAAAAFQRKAEAVGQEEHIALRRAVAARSEPAALGEATFQARRETVEPSGSESKPAAVAQAPPAKPKAEQEFADLKARAKENSPFTEYLLARAYLDGKGTAKDERLGMVWMNKAADDGSGDASTYLEGLKGKKTER
jgi:hypothetical protein